MTDTIPLGYTLFAVLALPRPRHGAPDAAALEDLTAAVAAIEARDRGLVNRVRRVLYALVPLVRRIRRRAAE